MDKKDLLSIGTLSKITKVHIKSLRYYDELGILKPAYIDEETNYRYYSFMQIQYVIAIQFCVELGIPLKDFSIYISDNHKILYSKLVEVGSIIAEKKIEAINQKLNMLKIVQEEIKRAEECLGSDKDLIYNLPEKLCYLTPFQGEIGSSSYRDMVNKTVLKINKEDLKIGYEIGLISFYKEKTWKRYIFIDVELENFVMGDNKNLYYIEKSSYLCRKMEESSKKNFENQSLPINFDKIVIEIDLFTGEYNLEDSKYEIRYKIV